MNNDQLEEQEILGGKPQRIPKPPKPNPAYLPKKGTYPQGAKKVPGSIALADIVTKSAKGTIDALGSYNNLKATAGTNIGEFLGQTAGKIGSAFSGKEGLPYDFTKAQPFQSNIELPSDKWKQDQIARQPVLGEQSPPQVTEQTPPQVTEQTPPQVTEKPIIPVTPDNNPMSQTQQSMLGEQNQGMNFQQPDLPRRNTLPDQQPGVDNSLGGEQAPMFDGQYVQNNYANLSDRTKNEERFARNEKDALAQDRASGAMVDRLNRGTKAMQELSQMRSGGGPAIANMNSNFRNPRLPGESSTNSERLGTKEWVAREKELKNSRADRAMDIRENANNQLPLGRTDRPEPDYGLEPDKQGLSASDQLNYNKFKFDQDKSKKLQAANRAKFMANPDNQYGMAIQNQGYMGMFRDLLGQGDKADHKDFDKLALEQGLPDFRTFVDLYRSKNQLF